jgi:hypothetical protein
MESVVHSEHLLGATNRRRHERHSRPGGEPRCAWEGMFWIEDVVSPSLGEDANGPPGSEMLKRLSHRPERNTPPGHGDHLPGIEEERHGAIRPPEIGEPYEPDGPAVHRPEKQRIEERVVIRGEDERRIGKVFLPLDPKPPRQPRHESDDRRRDRPDDLAPCPHGLPTLGGDGGPPDDDTATTTIAGSASQTTQPAGSAPSTAAPGPAGDINTATVTIDGQRYEFAAEGVATRCNPDFFGTFWVIARTADGSGTLEMLLVPEGNQTAGETSRVKVVVEDIAGRDWRADEDGGEGTPEGLSRVESFSIDGGKATGTALFVDVEMGDGATAEGTFEATCPEG